MQTNTLDMTPTLRDIMVANAQAYGDRAAYVHDDRVLTYAEYLVESRKLASALNRVGVRQQDRVGLLGMNSIDYMVMYGACQFSGYIASTVNFRLAGPEMEYVINDAGQRVLIFEAQYADIIGNLRSRLGSVETYICLADPAHPSPEWALDYAEFVASGDPAGPDLPPPARGDLVYLMYTSGTTGWPKGVMLDHSGQVNNARSIVHALSNNTSDEMLLMMPYFHVGAKALELAQFWVAGCVHVHREFNPEAILRTVSEQKITISHMAPTMIQAILECPAIEKYDVSSLSRILYSAAAMPTPVLRKALDTFGSIFVQMYGQTEGGGTILPVTAHKPDGDEKDQRRLGSIGHAVPGTLFKAVDDDDNTLPTGEPGELCYRGPAMMRGYWNNSNASIEALRGGWIHTGDVAKIDEDGYIYLVDRKKDMIISGGENIYSREVEEALLQHPAVSEAAVIGVPSKKWGEAVCAIIVAVKGQKPTAKEIIAHSREVIASYKRPQVVHFVDDLPKLVSGKISKIDLRKTFNTPLDE